MVTLSARWAVSFVGVLAALNTANAQSRPAADMILLGGKVFTSDSTRPVVEAIAIAGERVLHVGTNAEARALIGPRTIVYELDGRVVVPGFNDAHQHAVASVQGQAVRLGGTPPFNDPPLAEVLDSMSAAVSRIPPGTWIRGGVGTSVVEYTATPLRDILDRVAPNHPVYLSGAGTGHGRVLNTAALRALGISDATPDPLGGWLTRDANERPAGVLLGYAMLNADGQLHGRLADSVHVASWRSASATALQFGVTSIQNLFPAVPPAIALRAMRDAGLDVRMRLIRMPSTDATGGVAAWRAAEIAAPLSPTSRARVAGVKWLLDGTPVERFALSRAPYTDRAGWYGKLNLPTDTLRVLLREALLLPPGAEHQLLFHVSGDSAVALLLRTMTEIAPDTAWRARRVRIEHGDGLVDDLWPLARRLGVVVVQNPAHFSTPPGLMAARLGADRALRYQAFRSLTAAGIPIAIGSDGPVNPFLNIMLASLHPNNPAEAISRERAVIAYTHGSAFAEFAERDKGRLAPGMLADLAVLSQDIFTVEPQALPQTTSVLTIVGGRVVQDRRVVAPTPASPGKQ